MVFAVPIQIRIGSSIINIIRRILVNKLVLLMNDILDISIGELHFVVLHEIWRFVHSY